MNAQGRAAARRRALGRAGEDAAASFLTGRGFTILTRNYTTPFGELDIVATTENSVVFAEVKTARAGAKVDPRSQFTPRKVSRIFKTALSYLEAERPGEDVDVRFDFLVVTKTDKGYEIEHYAAVPLNDYLPAAED